MRKTFEELLEEEYYTDSEHDIKVIEYEDALELLRLCREKTIIECANKAEADWDYDKTICSNDETGFTDIECYVLKESILQLDKNSIEV